MTGHWILDDGQSLCYIECEASSSSTFDVAKLSTPTDAQDFSTLATDLSAGARNPDISGRQHTRYSCPVHTGFDPCLPSVDSPYTATQPGDVTSCVLDSADGRRSSAIQPITHDLDWSDILHDPLTVPSNGDISRKRALETSDGSSDCRTESVRRKRHTSRRQVIIRPAVKINLTDQTFLPPLANINLVMGFNTRLPNSRFDGYIHALRQLIRCSAEKSALGNNLKRALTAEGVLWVVRESWPAAEGYWNLTATFKGFLHAELWRNFPCERTYTQLPPEYRPTRAQLMVPHSPMIDWMPWPDLRDLAIRYQDEIDTDELFRMAILNVVAHRKKLIKFSPQISASPSDKKSFRVWDLVCLEKANGINPLADPGLTRKPVLHSPSARALVRAFDLEYDEFATQKLDSCFFEAFPSLYCDTAASNWTVDDFPTIPPEDVGYPVDLTSSAAHRLKSKFESMIGSAIEV